MIVKATGAIRKYIITEIKHCNLGMCYSSTVRVIAVMVVYCDHNVLQYKNIYCGCILVCNSIVRRVVYKDMHRSISQLSASKLQMFCYPIDFSDVASMHKKPLVYKKSSHYKGKGSSSPLYSDMLIDCCSSDICCSAFPLEVVAAFL